MHTRLVGALLAGALALGATQGLGDTARGLKAFKGGFHEVARKEFETSAAEGDEVAMYSLGVMQAQGVGGFARDMAKAVEWFTKSADLGFAEAQHALGRVYHGGGVGTRDVPKAVGWFEKAAANGNLESELALASIFYRGDGIEKDFERSASHIRRAAEAGISTAQMHLGYIHREGLGVEKSVDEAYYWLFLAMQNGLSEAASVISAIPEAELSTARRLELEGKANDFEPKVLAQ